jgi:hypothetical protein
MGVEGHQGGHAGILARAAGGFAEPSQNGRNRKGITDRPSNQSTRVPDASSATAGGAVEGAPGDPPSDPLKSGKW